jgi:hypothetical protein
VFGAFSVFMWGTRIRNALGDDASTAHIAFSVVVASLFTLGGLAVLVAALRRSHLEVAVGVLAAVTVVYWPIRAVQIALNGHSAGFVAVHTVLAVVSVSLAVWAWSGLRRPVRTPGEAVGRVGV